MNRTSIGKSSKKQAPQVPATVPPAPGRRWAPPPPWHWLFQLCFKQLPMNDQICPNYFQSFTKHLFQIFPEFSITGILQSDYQTKCSLSFRLAPPIFNVFSTMFPLISIKFQLIVNYYQFSGMVCLQLFSAYNLNMNHTPPQTKLKLDAIDIL